MPYDKFVQEQCFTDGNTFLLFIAGVLLGAGISLIASWPSDGR